MFLVLHVHAALQMESVSGLQEKFHPLLTADFICHVPYSKPLQCCHMCYRRHQRDDSFVNRGDKLVTRLPNSQPWCLIFVDSFRLYQPDGYPVNVSVPLRQWRRQV